MKQLKFQTTDYCCIYDGKCSTNEEGAVLPEKKVFFSFDSKNDDKKEWKNLLQAHLEKYKYAFDTFDEGASIGVGLFCPNICQRIKRAAFIIADVGSWDSKSSRYKSNPNVMLELGYSRGMGKPEILISNTHNITSDLVGQQIYTLKQSRKVIEKIAELCSGIAAFPKMENLSSFLDIQDRLLRIEMLHGERFYISDRLSILTRPLKITEQIAKERIKTQSWTQNHIDIFLTHINKRIKIFEENIKDIKEGYKYIDIYPLNTIRDFFLTGKVFDYDDKVSHENRLLHINRLLDLIEKPNYELILLDHLEGFNLLLKKGKIVALTPDRGRYGDWSSCIILTLSQVIDFNTTQVEQLLNQGRSKDEAVNELQKIKAELMK